MAKFHNRPFKFRAWAFKPFDPFDKYPEGKMSTEWFSRHDTSDWMVQEVVKLEELAQVDDNDHIMQNTGLFDQLQHEIFEGDVVWVEPVTSGSGIKKGLCKIIFHWGCFCLQPLSESVTTIEDIWPLFDYGSWNNNEEKREFTLTVIGHVHEHLEELHNKVRVMI